MPNQRRQNKRDENEYRLPGNLTPIETDFGSIGGITPIRQPDAGIQGRSDYGGSVYDQQYFTDDELRRAAEVRQAAERGETDWGSAHDYVEGIRGGYGYSGGTDGSGYNPTGGFSYQNAPDYVRRSQDYLDNALAMLQNRGPFEYDYASDPAWKAYKKEYTREGRRATEDTLGQYAAMTGGMPSTAAMTAASQAGDYYNARMTDKIPELYQLAYDMYLNEGNQLMQQANMYAGLYGDAYNRWNAEEQRRHDLWREGVDDEWRQKQWDYGVAQDNDEKALAAAKIAADMGDYSLLEQYYGIGPGTWQGLYDKANTPVYRGPYTPPDDTPFESDDDGEDAGFGEEIPIDMNSVLNLGYGSLDGGQLAEMEAQGIIESYIEDGRRKFRLLYKAPKVPNQANISINLPGYLGGL